MMKGLIAAVTAAGVDALCCYESCGIAPTSCNPEGEYCSSEATCGTCGGTWCGGPTPSPTPPSPPTPADAYCLGANDVTIAYDDGTGNVQLKAGGWDIRGNGGGASKAAFNLLGGYVEFDVDVTNVRPGVNANLYAIAPTIGAGGYTGGDYCDGADNDKPWCIELDWLESNGNCAAAATLHTVPGPGDNGCTAWGCRLTWSYNGETSYQMRVEYGNDGTQTLFKNGQVLDGYSPSPDGQAWGKIREEMQSKGVVIYGSEWTGWVPEEWCGTDGDLEASSYSISNIVVQGSVVQGPEPQKCGFATMV